VTATGAAAAIATAAATHVVLFVTNDAAAAADTVGPPGHGHGHGTSANTLEDGDGLRVAEAGQTEAVYAEDLISYTYRGYHIYCEFMLTKFLQMIF